MKETITRKFGQYQRTFTGFTAGQKVVAIVGTAALLLAGFLVFRWASTPSYSPLFSDLTSADAAAVIEKLDADGVPYELTAGGSTILVPQDKVYATRISLSGAGLPSNSDNGYSILDKQGLSTSKFQEQTNFKRAMETELSRTIEALNGVQTAVVHLALPEKQVFADEQNPATASVLVATRPGTTLSAEQVQAVVHLVASSIDGLAPEKVTVADSNGRVLSTSSGEGGELASSRNQQVSDYQDQMSQRIQSMLDRVVGAGNSSVTVTANLDFDKAVTESTSYDHNPNTIPLSQTKNTETYSGAGTGGVGGVVGPDGQMDSTTTLGGDSDSQYEKSSVTSDNAVDKTVERRETTPGSVRTLHVGVVLDAATARTIDPADVQSQITNAIGIDRARGDTVEVTTMPFDRTAETAAAKDLKAAMAADASAKRMDLYRNVGLIVLVLLVLALAWLKGRKKAKARVQATNYVVEQLRNEQLERAQQKQQQLEVEAAIAALESAEAGPVANVREELTALVERQPEDVAALLRGWLVER